jgi:uncharacterized protein (UPF0276 family)
MTPPLPGRGPAASRLPPRAGIGLKAEHHAALLRGEAEVGFVEVHAENVMTAGGPAHAALTRVRERWPLSIHGVGLSVGGAEPLDRDHLRRLRIVLDRYQPQAFSEHLAWSTHGGVFLNDLLPIRYDDAALQRVCEHVDQAQTVLGRTLLLENPSTYVALDGATIDEAQFIAEVVARTGCGLLLDLSNAWVSAFNHGRDVRAYLDALPLHAVGEIHLAGFDEDAGGARLLIDTHARAVDDAVWSLYGETVQRLGALPTLVEWDHDVPPLATLAAQAAKAERVLAAAPATAPPATTSAPAPLRGVAAARGRAEPLQGRFAAALLDPALPVPRDVVDDGDATQRFAVYRNNVVVSLTDALALAFPVVQALVGDEFFRAMAGVFVRRQPPPSPVLATWGERFPAFVADFEPAASLPYLADVAALEHARSLALHAADAPAAGPADAAAWLADAAALPRLRVGLHPSARVLRLRHAAVSLWAAHQGHLDIADVDPMRAEAALVVRSRVGGDPVHVVPVDAPCAAFAEAIASGMALGAAASSTARAWPAFDLARSLALLLHHGALTPADHREPAP